MCVPCRRESSGVTSCGWWMKPPSVAPWLTRRRNANVDDLSDPDRPGGRGLTERNRMTKEPHVTETTFRFTTTGGGFLINRIDEIEKLALSNLQSGKSLDRVVTGALVSLKDACNDARASVA